MTREKPPIAVTLERLRRRARLSQRRLGELSDVSAAAIARIEHGFDRKTGGPVKPEPETLKGLSRGLTASEDGPPDEAATLSVYRELLEAAGYDALILDAPLQAGSSTVVSEQAMRQRRPRTDYLAPQIGRHLPKKERDVLRERFRKAAAELEAVFDELDAADQE